MKLFYVNESIIPMSASIFELSDLVLSALVDKSSESMKWISFSVLPEEYSREIGGKQIADLHFSHLN